MRSVFARHAVSLNLVTFKSVQLQACVSNFTPISLTETNIFLLQLHVLPEGASEPAALLGCIRLVHWLAQSHVLGPQPLTLVVDCGTGTTATGPAIFRFAMPACCCTSCLLCMDDTLSIIPGRQ